MRYASRSGVAVKVAVFGDTVWYLIDVSKDPAAYIL